MPIIKKGWPELHAAGIYTYYRNNYKSSRSIKKKKQEREGKNIRKKIFDELEVFLKRGPFLKFIRLNSNY